MIRRVMIRRVMIRRVMIRRIAIRRVMIRRIAIRCVMIHRIAIRCVLIRHVLIRRVMICHVMIRRVMIRRIAIRRVMIRRIAIRRVMIRRVMVTNDMLCCDPSCYYASYCTCLFFLLLQASRCCMHARQLSKKKMKKWKKLFFLFANFSMIAKRLMTKHSVKNIFSLTLSQSLTFNLWSFIDRENRCTGRRLDVGVMLGVVHEWRHGHMEWAKNYVESTK